MYSKWIAKVKWMKFLVEEKCIVLKMLKFLHFWWIQKQKDVMPSKALLNIRGYSFHCFLKILGGIKLIFFRF